MKTLSHKASKGLTSKEVAAMMIQNQVDNMRQKPPTYEPSEVTHASQTLDNSPIKCNEFNKWIACYNQVNAVCHNLTATVLQVAHQLQIFTSILEAYRTRWLAETITMELDRAYPALDKKQAEACSAFTTAQTALLLLVDQSNLVPADQLSQLQAIIQEAMLEYVELEAKIKAFSQCIKVDFMPLIEGPSEALADNCTLHDCVVKQALHIEEIYKEGRGPNNYLPEGFMLAPIGFEELRYSAEKIRHLAWGIEAASESEIPMLFNGKKMTVRV